jgi:hypothetical protein
MPLYPLQRLDVYKESATCFTSSERACHTAKVGSSGQWKYELEVVIVCVCFFFCFFFFFFCFCFCFVLYWILKIKRYLLGGIADYVGRRIDCHRRGVADQIKKYSTKCSSIPINVSVTLLDFFAPLYMTYLLDVGDFSEVCGCRCSWTEANLTKKINVMCSKKHLVINCILKFLRKLFV